MANRIKPVLSVVIIAAAIAAIFVGLANAQQIQDWLKLRNYQPPSSIASLATQDSMTAYATHIFYVNHPQLQTDVTAFRQKCVISEQTIVLGCYLGGQRGIEIYDINDARLNGVEQVTAAHEMLHAAYDRLKPSERQSIDKQLQDFYQHDLKDQRIIDTINSYKQSEPNDVINEMHSVFGTEVSSLPAPLESYYQKYFTNRTEVTNYADSYQEEFTSRTAKINAYDTQLSNLRQRINAEEARLQNELSQLQSARAQIENSRDNSQIIAYNAQVNSYNQGVRKLQHDITNYNELVEQRNAIASELKSLQGSIDTRLNTQPEQ